MSMMICGAARLVASQSSSRAEVLEYWQRLEGLHFVHLVPQLPTEGYLDDSILRLWDSRDWVRFSLVGIADGRSATSDHLLLDAARQAQEVLKKQPTLTPVQVWTRVPQWRFLFFMFWHSLLSEGSIVVEHTSGDAATAEDRQQGPLTDVLSDLWLKYCWDMSCEDPSLYRFDLTLLPR